MNAKKAKKLRQLVKHLLEKSGMAAGAQYDEKHFRAFEQTNGPAGTESGLREVTRVTRTLKQDCGRAVYQQMKKAG